MIAHAIPKTTEKARLLEVKVVGSVVPSGDVVATVDVSGDKVSDF